MKASDLFVKCLEAEGVEVIFGVPGEENLDLLESLRTSGIRLVLTRHEQAAGFMAATLGRLTGSAGVCLATLGPGATNLVTAAAYAQLGAMPMLMVTGQKPVKSSKQGRFQILDVVEMMGPLTKYTEQVAGVGVLASRVREAFRLAQEERPGAAHLELPEDVAQEVGEEVFPLEESLVRRPVVEGKALDKAVEELAAAKRPLVLVGAGANRNTVGEALLEFLEKQRLPFVATQMGKGVVSDEHPQCVGTAALSGGDFVHEAIGAADLILNVGHDVVEKPPFFMERGGTRVVHVHYVSAGVDPVYFPQVELVGDIAASIGALNGRLERQGCWNCDVFDEVRGKLREDVVTGAGLDAFPLDPRRVVAEVRAAVPDDGIVTLDNGVYKIWFARNYAARGSNTLLLDNALATMGAGLPSALGAKVVYPGRAVVSVCGDGGFMMNSAELETAVREELDVVVLVLRDDSLGMIKWKQGAEGFGDYGLDFGNPDFVKYAEAYGARGRRVTAVDGEGGLRGELEAALAEGGVQVVEVPVDYAASDAVLNEMSH